MPASRRGRPLHTICSYLDTQKFFENKSCDHRQDEEQPNPVHAITRDLDIAIRVIDRNGLDRTILRQRWLCRREHTLPELPTQADSRNSLQVSSHTNSLRSALSGHADFHFIF